VPPPRAGVRILLIEDEAMLRDMTRETLERGGYAVLAACDGADAVRVADAHAGPIDLILTDVVMPGASGPRAVERLVPTHPRAKVLYVSGYSKEAVMPQVAAGTAFLAKPFAPDALLRTVRELLESP
jgi:CheY-like chemotaxis protein